MGIEDRDYYRESYAKKNGMRYNKRKATYSQQVEVEELEPEPQPRRRPPRPPSSPPPVDTDGRESYSQQAFDPRSRPRNQPPSFMFKLLVSFATAFICVLAYRYLR